MITTPPTQLQSAEQLFKPAKGKVDWLAAKLDYTLDRTVTYEDIASKHKVSLKEVKKHGVSGDWVWGRQVVSKNTETKINESIADERLAATERQLKLWKQAIDLIELQLNVLTANMEYKQALADREGRELSEKELLSPAKLLHLLKAMTVAINGERIAMGLPTKITAAPGYNADFAEQDATHGMGELELRAFIAQTDAKIATFDAQTVTT
jgi:hypothetical protein